MLPINVSKYLPTGSTNAVGTFSSAGVVTLGTGATFTTGRRVIVVGSSALGATVKITGLSESGTPISESVASSTTPGTAVQTTQDFLSVTAVTVSCAQASTTGFIGTSSQGSTPWYISDLTRNPINFEFYVRPTSTGVTATLEYTFDYPSYDVQGGLWNTQNSTAGPIAIASTVITALATAGFENKTIPLAAWRIVLTSSSSAAGGVAGTVIQSG